jgi:predicted exporter
MGSPERKSLQSMSVSHEQLHGAILMRVENEQGQSVEAPSEAQATYTSGEMTRPIVGELLSLDLTLTRDEADPTRGPVVRRWTMRVVPAPASVDEILVPILLADVVKDSGTDVEHNYDPFGVLFRLKTLENDRTVVTYREGQASYLVTVRAVGMEGAKDWTSNRRFLNGVLMVRLITCEGIPPQLPGGEF